jgi:DNA polymerase-3 subunit delta'
MRIMGDIDGILEADRLNGTPHPRERFALFGHEEAENAFVDGLRSGRMHHAWLIGGPQGIGKATLAYRVARRLLDLGSLRPGEEVGLAVDPNSAVARQVAALSHPNLAVLRRTPGSDKKGASATIPVDAVRRALQMFGSTAAGGYRVCIVDSAEDLTIASANALLKVIEEPPARSIFLIVSHAPQRLLPTIRSRCRRLLLRPLADADIRAAVESLGPPWCDQPDELLRDAISLGEGSVRRTLEMLDGGKLDFVAGVKQALDALPDLDPKRVLTLAESLARRDAEEEYGLALETVERWVTARLHARAGEGALRLAPLVEVCEKVALSAREADIYNLDRRPLVLALFDDLADAVRRTA